MEGTISKRRGRPPTEIIWPNSDFTVDDITRQSTGLSKVAIQLRINKAMNKDKTLVIAGKQGTTGRPRITYRRAELVVNQ